MRTLEESQEIIPLAAKIKQAYKGMPTDDLPQEGMRDQYWASEEQLVKEHR